MGRATTGIAILFLGLACSPVAAGREASRLGPRDLHEPDGSGGGEFVLRHAPHLSEERRAEIREELRRNLEILRADGRLPAAPTGGPVRLSWPLAVGPGPLSGFPAFGYHGISNFVDHNGAFPGRLLDFACGARTYDLSSGYNHKGTDIFTWPFGWRMMDLRQVAVVSGAPGMIVLRSDGNFDRNCSFNSGNWNAVYVAHDDDSVAWYGHLKRGSLTAKPLFSRVERGEYLGIVGSSGSSTGPHLHLELYDAASRLVDPYEGACNGLNASSLWTSQQPYYDSAVNHLTTGNLPPSFPSCPNAEQPNTKTVFEPGETIYFTAFYRDQRSIHESLNRILRPDGSLYAAWPLAIGDPHYAASWWWRRFDVFAPEGPGGAWKYEVEFDGTTYSHTFFLGGVSGALARPSLRLARAAGGAVRLDWGDSCLGSDTDFEIYEGSLGEWYSHTAIYCSTAGQRSQSLSTASDAAYYLVVPTNTVDEGGYGADHLGIPRPPGLFQCRTQQAEPCVAPPALRRPRVTRERSRGR